jgi:hypothetical protein
LCLITASGSGVYCHCCPYIYMHVQGASASHTTGLAARVPALIPHTTQGLWGPFRTQWVR